MRTGQLKQACHSASKVFFLGLKAKPPASPELALQAPQGLTCLNAFSTLMAVLRSVQVSCEATVCAQERLKRGKRHNIYFLQLLQGSVFQHVAYIQKVRFKTLGNICHCCSYKGADFSTMEYCKFLIFSEANGHNCL